ncbi:hypothetical protein CI109_101306 [Kwoniella shandongensis]|uniref:Uncharacterized protein n=1 Tax=Kwoniella shandongensis TaxID=1734106 RepID=A0A5M6BZF3_9TREE|nr:uncharacterized protein CI109_005316 [Kwoniella shandongensis]KAA5526359.1 hypothetical protein CI109_005316 [Kwoniella shandongensis]
MASKQAPSNASRSSAYKPQAEMTTTTSGFTEKQLANYTRSTGGQPSETLLTTSVNAVKIVCCCQYDLMPQSQSDDENARRCAGWTEDQLTQHQQGGWGSVHSAPSVGSRGQ